MSSPQLTLYSVVYMIAVRIIHKPLMSYFVGVNLNEITTMLQFLYIVFIYSIATITARLLLLHRLHKMTQAHHLRLKPVRQSPHEMFISLSLWFCIGQEMATSHEYAWLYNTNASQKWNTMFGSNHFATYFALCVCFFVVQTHGHSLFGVSLSLLPHQNDFATMPIFQNQNK